MSERVLLGMSGGVDSSVAAFLLKEQGYTVVGVTLLLWNGEAEVEDAAKVADMLGIEFHVIDLCDTFRKKVVDYFVNEYNTGRTPNPCIACNKHIKFGEMFNIANELNCRYVATGHYADKYFDEAAQCWRLKVSDNTAKDQSYVLFCITPDKLERVLFPVSNYEKQYLRSIAEQLGLDVAKKKDSQDICFVPDKDYANFVENWSQPSLPGVFVDTEGNAMGHHKGIIHYTIGQRKGLGLALKEPAFVVKIDAENNRVVLGKHDDQFSSISIAKDINFVCADWAKIFADNAVKYINKKDEVNAPSLRCAVKIRYSAPPVMASCRLIEQSEKALSEPIMEIIFDEPQRAVTPGQAIVLYDENFQYVVGGGIIS